MDTSDLAKRMKGYEYVTRTHLITRMPVIIRLDGKAFHTFTRGFKRPFDDVLIKTMQETTKYLCENIQGCVLGYTQSDEITLVLVDYKTFSTNAWFDYNIQKCTSVAASMATMAFNKAFAKAFDEWGRENLPDWDDGGTNEPVDKKLMKLCEVYSDAQKKGAMFDARIFNLQKEEVTNNIYWRQLDASRNSIQMLGQAYFSHKELHRKNTNQIQDMLMVQKGINWNDLPTYKKRGSCCIRKEGMRLVDKDNVTVGIARDCWIIDEDIPIFKGEGRKYIDSLVYVGD